MSNPLLNTDTLPAFSQILPEHVEPALDQILQENRRKLAELLDKTGEYTWENLIQPLEELDDRLDKMWSPVTHLNAVANNEELRKVYNACLPKLSAYATELGQNQGLYQAYLAIAHSDNFSKLTPAQQKAVKDALLDFQLSGVALEPAAKKRYAEIQQQLSLLTSKFEENVLDATHAWFYHTENEAELAGIPRHALNEARETAKQKNLNGWVFTLDYPSYSAVISFADNRQLREQMYQAYVTKASDQGPHAGRWDNSNVMQEILKLRFELAKLLGFKNYTELSLATKMAKETRQVLTFLNDLAKRSRPIAQQELADLQQFAKDQYGVEKLEAWDLNYYTEKLQQYRYQISQEDVRPYFPADKVLKGLFTIVEKLYGMHIIEVFDIDVWHKDVRFFAIYDAKGTLRGQFYLDLHPRSTKRGGAWMDECRVRRRLINGEIQIPVAYLTCNFTPPTSDKPALFTHDEVITLFHEFGHGLQHMLSTVDYAAVSGINGVAWDAVEFPSQFMENWCWEKAGLDIISGHYQTNEPLPDALLQKLLAAKNFHSALHMIRQLEFALFDFRLHMEFDPKQSGQIQILLNEVRKTIGVVPVPIFNRFQHSFAHIFSGGYAAGYYSYKWAEVLASDAYAKFEEHGIFNPTVGKQFLTTILEQGGSREPMELFVEFRGREPTIEALLRHSGLAA